MTRSTSRARSRLIALLTAVSTVLAGFAVVSAAPAPVGAAPTPITLTMPNGGGTLTLRGAQPRALAQPTTVTATQETDTAVISAGTFSTPDVAIEQYLPEYDLTAFVDAHFRQLGTVRGTIDQQKKVTLRIDVAVDLHIEVGKSATENPALVGDCSASPVNLVLTGTLNATNDSVNLTGNFSIPQLPTSDECPDLISGGVNDLIAGSGHKIALRLDGALTPPPPPGAETASVLEVTPADGASVGDDVTLDVTVTNEEEPGDTPTGGDVEFKDGSTVVGVAELVNGEASITTDALQAGTRSLTATYLGVQGEYAESVSDPVLYAVGAPSLVTGTGPASITIGAEPGVYNLVVRNPGPGAARTQRADLTIRRFGVATNPLGTSNLVVEVKQPDNTWAPVALTGVPAEDIDLRDGVVGSLDPNAGVALAAGATRTITFRLSTATAPAAGPVRMSVELAAPASPVEAAPLPGTIPNMWTRDIDLLPATRITPTIEPGIFGFSWGVPQARAGGQATVAGLITDSNQEAPYRGRVRAFLDGKPVLSTLATPLRTAPFGSSAALDIGSGAAELRIAIPAETAPGDHTIVMSYTGDEYRNPVTSPPIPLAIAPALGRTFECVGTYALERSVYRVTIDGSAQIPSLIEAGSTGVIDDLQVRIYNNRDSVVNNLVTTFGITGTVHELGVSTTVVGATATLSDGSTGSFDTATYAHLDPNIFGPPEPENPDATITLDGGEHGFDVSDTPGETVPVEIESLQIDLFEPNSSLPIEIVCNALDGNLELGEATAGGIDLAVDPGVVTAGDSVNLTATVVPDTAAGAVVFKDGDTIVTYAPVAGGVAAGSVSTLAIGTHQLTAEFVPSSDAPAMTSDPQKVTVVPVAKNATEAFVIAALVDFTGEASEADVAAGVAALEGGQSKSSWLRGLSKSTAYLTYVVNQMYLDTLGREGDAGGVAFWVGKLQSGTPVHEVAASFYGSAEYFNGKGGGDAETWVADLYTTLLGREGSPAEIAYWVGEIPVRTRGGVAKAFYQTPESGRFRVAKVYDKFLGRAPSAADLAYWTPIVRAKGDLELAVALASSAEYQTLANGRFPFPEDPLAITGAI